MSSRIEQIIEEIEEYIDSCKFQPLSTTKIIVNKDQIDELLRELRMKTPDEIKRYQKIISNKDAILADAQAKADAVIAETKTQVQDMVKESEVMQQADAMIEEAQVQTTELVSEHEIMQQAYAQANEIVNSANQQAQAIIDSATADANNLRLSAISYTDEMMANLEQLIHGTMENANARYNELAQTYNAFAQSLQSAADVVSENRSELAPQLNNPIPKQAEQESEENLDMDDLDDELEEDDE